MHSGGEPPQASCPVRSYDEPSTASKLNPLNQMPSLSQKRGNNQSIELPVEREISSIPRGDAASNWEYPSPQQMYNAMLRKGHDDTPQDAVESMVAVHNFLNEGAWAEIVAWEKTFGGGLMRGWKKCLAEDRGEEGIRADGDEADGEGENTAPPPRLLRFQGRPKDMTPKASILQLLGQIYPSKFGTEPPFDRHDWFVQRQSSTGPIEVRYVIDYYAAPPEPTGEPVFYLDIRPAADGPRAVAERLLKWGAGVRPREMWEKASGASARMTAPS